MVPPPFPELPTDSPLHEVQQRLISLRQSLEKACQDLDEQIATLGGELEPAPPPPRKSPARPQPTQAHRDAAAEFTRRLFEANPVPAALELDPDEPLAVESAAKAEDETVTAEAPTPRTEPTAPLKRDHPAMSTPVETPAQVIEATANGGLDPELERATLEELNNALSAAFDQISKNRSW